MSTAKEKGTISQKLCFEIEWTFGDILSYTTKDKLYYSPTFSVPGSEWYLHIYPNGQTKNDSVGWIGLYLLRGCDDSSLPKSVNYDFGVKKADGTIEVIISDTSYVFDKKSSGWGFPKFLQRSQLQKRRSELTLSGALTVTCTMRVKDALDCTSRLIELSEDFKTMFASKQNSDATLKVQGTEFAVHKSVLTARSLGFEALLVNDMKDKKTKVLDIHGCLPSSFKDFLVYIYSGRFEETSDNVCELYRIAHKYCADSLMSACVQYIMEILSLDNVLNVYILAHQHDELELKSKVEEFFKQNVADIIPTFRWSSFLKNYPTLANELLVTMAKDMKDKENEKVFFGC